MPLYEYVCQDCKRKTEVLQRMKERPLRICPHCGGRLKKAFSAPAIQFKGSGFYTTDYARGTNAGKSGESPKAGSDSKSSEAKASESNVSEPKPAEPKPSEAKKEKTSETKTGSKKESKKT
jgi:putative FmdB family regulatory protein